MPAGPVARSPVPLLAFVALTPILAFTIHEVGAGRACGWNYTALGGACRFIILLSIAGGGLAASLAAASIQAVMRRRLVRAIIADTLAIAVVVGAILYAQQIERYRENIVDGPGMVAP